MQHCTQVTLDILDIDEIKLMFSSKDQRTLEWWDPVASVARRPVGKDSVKQSPILFRNEIGDDVANVADVFPDVESLEEGEFTWIERHEQLESVFTSTDVPGGPSVLVQLQRLLDVVDDLGLEGRPGEGPGFSDPAVYLIAVAKVFVHPYRLHTESRCHNQQVDFFAFRCSQISR